MRQHKEGRGCSSPGPLARGLRSLGDYSCSPCRRGTSISLARWAVLWLFSRISLKNSRPPDRPPARRPERGALERFDVRVIVLVLWLSRRFRHLVPFFWLAANDLQFGAMLPRWGGLNERIARISTAAM